MDVVEIDIVGELLVLSDETAEEVALDIGALKVTSGILVGVTWSRQTWPAMRPIWTGIQSMPGD